MRRSRRRREVRRRVPVRRAGAEAGARARRPRRARPQGPQDPGFEAALEGGVTTLQILPGSANLIGGRSVVVKNVQAVTYQAMKFPGAAYGLKMACGENPKRVYGAKNQAPSTRMGNVAGYRQAFADAQDYQQQWDKYHRELPDYNKKKAERADGAGKKSKDKDGAADKEPDAAQSAEARSEARDPGGGHEGQLSACTCTAIAPMKWRPCSMSPMNSASRSWRSIMPWRPTRSPIVWPTRACARRCGPIGGASRWKPTTACRKICHGRFPGAQLRHRALGFRQTASSA